MQAASFKYIFAHFEVTSATIDVYGRYDFLARRLKYVRNAYRISSAVTNILQIIFQQLSNIYTGAFKARQATFLISHDIRLAFISYAFSSKRSFFEI